MWLTTSTTTTRFRHGVQHKYVQKAESKEEEEKSYATAIHGSAMLGTFFLLDLRIYCLRMKRELYIQLPQQTDERKLGRGVIYTSGIVRVRLATNFPFHLCTVECPSLHNQTRREEVIFRRQNPITRDRTKNRDRERQNREIDAPTAIIPTHPVGPTIG